MSWSWQRAKSRIILEVFLWGVFGLVFGLIFGLVLGIQSIVTWDLEQSIEVPLMLHIFSGFIGALIGGLIGGLLGVLASGFGSVKVKQKTVPNQGIWSSRKNFLRVGLIFGSNVGLIVVLIHVLFWVLMYRLTIIETNNIKLSDMLSVGLHSSKGMALSFGLIFGLFFGIRYGGTTCIQHFNLRRILHRKGHIPWNYARFLDYASERLLMKKVGGGYIFYHRMLMEHFAQRH